MTEDEIRALMDDRAALALTLWGEARGEPVEGAIAVACVIRNRAQDSGQSVKDVCLASKQFSCWNRDGSANHAALLTIAEHVIGSGHGTAAMNGAYRQCRWIAEGVIGDSVIDRTNHAVHYLTRVLFESPQAPAWAQQMIVTARIGHHVFGRPA